MIRLFVGLALPGEITRSLAGLAHGLAGARWVEERNLHLTLRFIGEVAEPVAEDIHHELAAIGAAGFGLDIKGLGLFGDGHRAHTLWAGVERGAPLVDLAGRVDAAVIRGGARPEPRRFTPHITLARIKDCAPAQVQDFIATMPHPRWDNVVMADFVLFQSALTRHGAQYDVLARYPLGADI